VDDPVSTLTVSGVDAPRVSAWLLEQIPQLEPPLQFTRVGEGQSNLTFRIDDAGGRSVVLRRPPLGEILASAHDVVREHRILTALRPAGVPVPRTVALCADESVTGAPFYVMEHVSGLILTRLAVAERLAPDARAAAGKALASTLADLHAVDLDDAGLGDFKRPESLISRQLRRWQRQWEASKMADVPDIDEVAKRLTERMPDERETVLLHGDYHLHNVVLGETGDVRALLDWELCTAGDPLADVGQMVAYWNELADSDGLFREPVAALEGFPSARELAAAYGSASDRDVDSLGYWVAFAYWKIAIIVAGVYRRWLNDPTNGTDAGSLGPAVDRLADRARRALDGEVVATAPPGTLNSTQPEPEIRRRSTSEGSA
jgi:aminoglycoside phosphotransferase (APT) family kinase protein